MAVEGKIGDTAERGVDGQSLRGWGWRVGRGERFRTRAQTIMPADERFACVSASAVALLLLQYIPERTARTIITEIN